MDGHAPPPRPPPHSGNPKSSGLPPGNYDIFVVPPHSSGSGFLYLPSLQPHRNSFLAGVACTLAVVGVWAVVVPILKSWASSLVASGGTGVILLMAGVGVLGWAYGKTQMENIASGSGAGPPPFSRSNATPGAGTGPSPFGNGGASWARPDPGPGAAGWEKAREEMRKKEEERKKKEDTDKKAKEAADKDRLDKSRQREREAREKEAREKVTQERLKREKEMKEKEQREKAAKAANYQKPSAQSYVGDDDGYSFRPYDKPKQPAKHASNGSFVSESSWAGTHSTARTTPPPSHRGPYVNKDPDKVTIRAVYAFTDLFPKPIAQLISGGGTVSDGLVLRMTTEGLFIDDDIRGVGQREWDIKAWTIKLVEVSIFPAYPLVQHILQPTTSKLTQFEQSGDLRGKHVLRASIRDANNKKYVFVIDDTEAWKVAVGLQRLRRGTQVRSLGVQGMNANEMAALLKGLGWG